MNNLIRKFKKKVGCSKCLNGRVFVTESYTPFHSSSYSYRCECTEIPSNKYTKSLANTNLSKLEYDNNLALFYDNHADKEL